MTALTITNATAAAIMAQAKPGDTIALGEDMTDWGFHSLSMSTAVTIDARSHKLIGFKGTAIQGFNFLLGDVRPGVKNPYGFRVDTGSHIKTHGGHAFSDTNKNDALFIQNGADVEVDQFTVDGFAQAVAFSNVDQVWVHALDAHNLGGDGGDFANCRNVIVEDSVVYMSRTDPSKHPDGFQFWSTDGKPRSDNLTIRRNIVFGGYQGISLFNHPTQTPPQIGFGTVTIEDNEIFNSFPQAIAVTDADVVNISGNRVRTIPGSQFQSTINLTNCKTVNTPMTSTVAAYKGWKAKTV